ncbi:MAG: Slp family lipoprotein [Nitrospirota bacterium]|nr:Slp family lipoprotein [Nitrospirota bacterium]
MKCLFILIPLSVALVSCAHVISREYVDVAEKNIPFKELQQNTDAYLHKMFIFGGIIAETKITGAGSEIEVVHTPLDRFGNITDRDFSEGRFIIMTTKYLDPLIYRNSRDITFAGILNGTRKQLLGDIEYVYPVFDAKEIYLWKEEKYYLYPYGYPYWYDPFYYPPVYYPYYRFWYRPYLSY